MGTRHLTRTGPIPSFVNCFIVIDFETSFPGLRFFLHLVSGFFLHRDTCGYGTGWNGSIGGIICAIFRLCFGHFCLVANSYTITHSSPYNTLLAHFMICDSMRCSVASFKRQASCVGPDAGVSERPSSVYRVF